MVSPELIAQVESLSPAERWALHEHIERLDLPEPDLTDEQKDLIRSRDAEADADPSVLESFDEHIAFARSLLK